MKASLLPLFPLFFVLAACATMQHRNALVSEVQIKGNDSELTSRIERGEELSVSEVEQLRKINVEPATIIAYMKSTKSVYVLSKSDIARLQQIPGNEELVAYMLKTPTLYRADGVERRDPYSTPDSEGGYVPYYRQQQ